MRYRVISLISVPLLFTLANTANADSFIDEADFFEDVQTVVSATRLKQKISNAPVSVTIIDREMIDASGATEIYDLFRLVPGFFSYSLQGNQFSVINHYKPNEVSSRLEVQVNGRSVYDPLFSAVNWTSLGLDIGDIDYIEVIRGSNASAYGSNAFLGAINIITKDVISRPQATIRSEIGNLGRKNITVNKNGNLNDLDYGFSFVYRNDNGFEPLSASDALIPGSAKDDDRISKNITFEGSYTPDLNNELSFSIGFGESNTEIFSAVDPRGHASRTDIVQHQKFNWKHKENNRENSLQFSHDYLKSDVKEVFFPLSSLLGVAPELIPSLIPGQQDQLLERDAKPSFAERLDIEFVHKDSSRKTLSYVLGFGARKDTVKSGFFFGDGKKKDHRFRVFGNLDWHFHKKANLNIGLMLEDTDVLGTASSPRVALNWHPKENHTIRTSITRAQQAGSLSFVNLETRLNDGTTIDTLSKASDSIGKEFLTAFEVAYIAKFPNIKTQFDIKFFREEMRNFGVTQNRPFADLSGDALILDNLLDLNTKGLEFQLTHKFLKIPDLTARLSYAYFDSDGSYPGDISNPNSLIDEGAMLPKHSGTLLLNKKLANSYSISSLIQYQSDVAGEQNRQVNRVDFRLGKKLKFSGADGKIDFVIQNAFDDFNDFATRNSKNVFETRGFVRLEANF